MTNNSAAHRIRLAGPWQTVSDVDSTERVKLPFRPDDSTEPLVVSRSFNGSAGMLAADKVCVRVAYDGPPPSLELNQQPVNPSTAPVNQLLVAEITQLLKQSNILVLNCGTNPAGQVNDVSLLIFEQSAQ